MLARRLALLAMLAPAMTHAQETEEPKPELRNLTSGVFISLPLGLSFRHDVGTQRGLLRIGLFDSFAVYSNEAGVSIGVATNPEFLEAHLDLAAEPGFYVKVPASGDVDEDRPRVFQTRLIARGQVNFNLRYDRYWLYSRTTGWYRWRDFEELDVWRDVAIREEWGIEEAFAPIFRIDGPERPDFWIYLEYTVGGVDRVGTIPHRASTGVITEGWPSDRLSMNLDLFYSFDDRPGQHGPGVIFAWWWKW